MTIPIHTSPSRTIETAKLLMDWSKWLVTVQTAAITALGFLLKMSDPTKLPGASEKIPMLLALGAVLCFVVSILHATYLMLFLPAIVERIPESIPENTPQNNVSRTLWHVAVPFWPGWQVGTFTVWQSRLFCVGIVMFAGAYIAVVSTNF